MFSSTKRKRLFRCFWLSSQKSFFPSCWENPGCLFVYCFRASGTGFRPWGSLLKVNYCSFFFFFFTLITYDLDLALWPNPGVRSQLSDFRIRFASLFFSPQHCVNQGLFTKSTNFPTLCHSPKLSNISFCFSSKFTLILNGEFGLIQITQLYLEGNVCAYKFNTSIH